MSKYTKFLGLIIITVFLISCKEKSEKKNSEIKIKETSECSLISYRYSDVKDYQLKGCLKNELPLTILQDLNGDGINEEFLMTETYGRGSFYTLYTLEGKQWKIISSLNEININHLGIELDSIKNGKWKGFKTFESINEYSWVWNKNKYELVE